jgi:radical SAM superfamily enzyme YgiQ (UPF0313 family)
MDLGEITMNSTKDKRKIIVGLVQINNIFSGQKYLPYSAGLLEAHCKKHSASPEGYEFLYPIYYRQKVSTMVEHLKNSDIIGFSTYVWNMNISLAVAKQIKQNNPETLIIFGGPQVPDNAEEFLTENKFIDIVCHGEGEQSFLSILEEYPSKDWKEIPGISFYAADGAFTTHPISKRIHDLSRIPSPYLEDVFLPLMKSNPQESWLALWETNRGCPFSCSFCDWGSATNSKLRKFALERLFQEMEWFAKHKVEFVFCCDSNFGILERDIKIAQYAVKVKGTFGFPHVLSVQNTKNATDRSYEVQKLFASAGLSKGVTLSFQSLNPDTLTKIGRKNISIESFMELQRRFTRDGIETYSDLILGLPGETYESFADGTSYLIENGQHNRIQFNNLSILPNAELGDPEYQKKHGMVTVKTKIFNIHGSLDELEEEIIEEQELLIATSTMTKDEWAKARTFSWLAGLLHFDKLLQISLIILNRNYFLSFRELFEAFMDTDEQAFPTISRIYNFFLEKAKDIQNGGSEYCLSKEFLNIGWPADEYVLINLCTEGDLKVVFREAEERLSKLLKEKCIDLPPGLLNESMQLNLNLIKLPFQKEDIYFEASYNIWEFYQSILVGKPILLKQEPVLYRINRTKDTYSSWDEWCRKVIWYGHRKGAYLYANDLVERRS